MLAYLATKAQFLEDAHIIEDLVRDAVRENLGLGVGPNEYASWRNSLGIGMSHIIASPEIPNEAGSLGPNSTVNNSVTQNVKLKSQLVVNGSGKLYKSVEPQSITINSEIVSNGQTNVSGTSFTHFLVDRTDVDTDNRVNYFYSFGLPLNSTEDYKFTGTTYSKGGFSDTALSGIAQDTILIISLNQETYGETLDGKVINLTLPSLGPTYNIYSTFQNSGIPSKTQDANIRDNSVVADTFGTNIAFLFSDNIMTPNGGSGSLSWATGFGTNKPFSVNNKQLYNLQTNSNRGLSADTVVGIAYLDKGILVMYDDESSLELLVESTILIASSTTFESKNILQFWKSNDNY
jgi:hypothetical protein